MKVMIKFTAENGDLTEWEKAFFFKTYKLGSVTMLYNSVKTVFMMKILKNSIQS